MFFMRFGKKRHFIAALSAAVICVFVLSGCGNNMYYSSAGNMSRSAAGGYDGGSYAESAVYDVPEEELPEGTSLLTTGGEEDQLFVTTVDMDVETMEYDAFLDLIGEKIEESGGYIESLDLHNGNSYFRFADLTIRIPQDVLYDFVRDTNDIGNVTYYSEYSENVTLTYVDLESRRNTLEAEEERLLELMETAESVEDIISIESRLSEVRYSIESLESQLRTYDNRISYSTVYMYISEVDDLTPMVPMTPWQRIRMGFSDSLYSIGTGFVEMCIWIASNSPYLFLLAVAAACVVLIVLLIDRSVQKSRLKKAGGQQQGDIHKDEDHQDEKRPDEKQGSYTQSSRSDYIQDEGKKHE